MRTLLPALMIALFALPFAAAEANETRPDDAAWVDDCPPDMMCAAGGQDPAPDCGAEVCAYDETPQQYGPDGCIECSGPVRGPADGSCENCRGDVVTQSDDEPANEVPGLTAGLFGAALAVAVFLAARRG